MNQSCICQSETDFYVDTDGAALPAGAVIICKKKPFIVTEELYIDEFLGGEINVVYQVKDEEFSYPETQVREQNIDKWGGLFTNIYRTVMGNHRKTHRKKITGIPDTPVTENNSNKALDNLGASYLDNIINLANSTNRGNVAEQLLTEKLSNLIVTTFHDIFQNVTLDRLSEVSPKVNSIMRLFQGLLQILATNMA